MLPKENRLFVDDSLKIAVGRVIFVKWMRQRGKWAAYMNYMRNCSTSKLKWKKESYHVSWESPKEIIEFLSRNGFEYDECYLPWKEICNSYLTTAINQLTRDML